MAEEGKATATDNDEIITMMKKKTIFILADDTGVTAKTFVQNILDYQFNEVDERFVHCNKNGGVQPGNDDDDEDEEDEGSQCEEKEASSSSSISSGRVEEEAEYRCEMARLDVNPFTRTEEDVVPVLRKAEELHGMVVFTFSDPVLRAKTCRMCELSNLNCVDLSGPLCDKMATFFHRKPYGAPRNNPPHLSEQRKWALSDEYYRRIEAIEYTLECDDGESTSRLCKADVILVGVSRTGKTPLSVVIAQTMGLKVANVPLVVDEPVSRHLLGPDIDRSRVFCLTLDPSDLQRIRKTRMKRALGGGGGGRGGFVPARNRGVADSRESSYDDIKYIFRDLENARAVAKRNGFTMIDVTGRAVEETANLLTSMLHDRFPNTPSLSKPSAITAG